MMNQPKEKQIEKMDVAWDRMSLNYSEHTGLRPDDLHYRELANRFPACETPVKVLDLGSGLGFALDGILPRIPNAKVTCLDLSHEMLKKLMDRLRAYSSQIEILQGSYVKAELGSNQYDFVLSAFTVHHLPKPTKLLLFKKIHSALNSGGSYFELDGVASEEQEKISQEEYVKHIAHRDGAAVGNWNHDMCLTIFNETKLLMDAGFTEVSVPWTDTDQKGSGRAIFVARK